jgi:hypothetical protein
VTQRPAGNAAANSCTEAAMAMQKLSPGDSALLKAWVVERLTPLLDHDPGPAEYLSNYVMLIVDVSVNLCIHYVSAQLLSVNSPAFSNTSQLDARCGHESQQIFKYLQHLSPRSILA